MTYAWTWRGGGMGYVRQIASKHGVGDFSNRRCVVMVSEDEPFVYPVDFEIVKGAIRRSVYPTQKEALDAAHDFVSGNG